MHASLQLNKQGFQIAQNTLYINTAIEQLLIHVVQLILDKLSTMYLHHILERHQWTNYPLKFWSSETWLTLVYSVLLGEPYRHSNPSASSVIHGWSLADTLQWWVESMDNNEPFDPLVFMLIKNLRIGITTG